jgi:hypothetical protein
MARYRSARQTLPPLAALVFAGLILGCAGRKDTPETTISWLAPQTRAAKSADCQMPMLGELPNVDYQEIALVEVTGDYDADDTAMSSLARRKACETGADALVILENQQQKRGEPLAGASATEGKDLGPQTGANVRAREHAPEVGEVGHKGRFLDAIAIVYKAQPRTSR